MEQFSIKEDKNMKVLLREYTMYVQFIEQFKIILKQ